MCTYCPDHYILPFEELIGDPPSEGIDIVQARLDYDLLKESLARRSPTVAGGTPLPNSLWRAVE